MYNVNLVIDKYLYWAYIVVNNVFGLHSACMDLFLLFVILVINYDDRVLSDGARPRQSQFTFHGESLRALKLSRHFRMS